MEKILDNIKQAGEVKNLSLEELNTLSSEIRNFLIESVSKTGGHLASNLGVVELTLALHKSFDFPKDKIVWDVGHQCYTHKILTGRKSQMSTIRQFGGISGFPKRDESEYDFFDTGHSSTSISAAVGIARARDIKNEDHQVIAFIGDGAMTGGMCFEALNDIGHNNSKVIVILNDNEMSISENVGALSKHLSNLRTTPGYLHTKKDVEIVLSKIPVIGKHIKKTIRTAKYGIKKMVVPNMIFEELGLKYLGPVDGHNIPQLLDVMKRAKEEKGSVLIHVRTVKGKGYTPAEERPNDYHGVSSFDIETGESKKISSEKTYSDIFGETMASIVEKRDDVVVISAAMIEGTGLKEFAQKYPKKIFDVGIAEPHSVTMAAGMATSGIVPVVSLYSSFLQRAYDQVVHDVATQNLHVVFALDRAGLVGADGETHQGVFDGGFLSGIPNMTVMIPTTYKEQEAMINFGINAMNSPVAIRYPRGSSKMELATDSIPIELGKGVIAEVGTDITLIASGKMVFEALIARELLLKKGISAEVLNLRFIKPLDKDLILKSGLKTKKVVVIDEAPIESSIAYRIKNILPEVEMLYKTIPDEFTTQGAVEKLYEVIGIDGKGIADSIEEWLK